MDGENVVLAFVKIGNVLLASLALAAFALAEPGSVPGSLHIRGTVESLKAGLLTVRTAKGLIQVQLGKAPVARVIPADRSQIKEGSFLGIASVPGPSGRQTAREVLVFPEAARGSGEGSYPWDLPVGGSAASQMTNGTVRRSAMTHGVASKSTMTNGTVRSAGSGETLTVTYKDGKGTGTQTIRLTPGIPIVTFEPGATSQLTPGAHVIVFAHSDAKGTTVADRTLVGKNGLVPPM